MRRGRCSWYSHSVMLPKALDALLLCRRASRSAVHGQERSGQQRGMPPVCLTVAGRETPGSQPPAPSAAEAMPAQRESSEWRSRHLRAMRLGAGGAPSEQPRGRRSGEQQPGPAAADEARAVDAAFARHLQQQEEEAAAARAASAARWAVGQAHASGPSLVNFTQFCCEPGVYGRQGSSWSVSPTEEVLARHAWSAGIMLAKQST